MSNRPAIPAAVKRKVLDEFNNLCAICAAIKPQIHHIDEDATNNDPMNLLPLCPTHHLTDQHNPTRRIEQGRLRLFRKYKDPFILADEFQPLFKRMEFMYQIDPNVPIEQLWAMADENPKLESSGTELGQFVTCCAMGNFYGPRVADLVRHHDRIYAARQSPERAKAIEQALLNCRQFLERRDETEELIIQMLRFQNWRLPRRPEMADYR